jgi:hypothetical protein
MKRFIIISGILILYGTVINAQSMFDALKLTDADISGTARYTSMAGAFGALGGDVSAIKDNPAGLGVFRKGEISLTLNTKMQASEAAWAGRTAIDNQSHFGVSNVALVLALPTWRNSGGYGEGLLMSNFSFGYNKLKDFNGTTSIRRDSTLSSITDYYGYFTGTLDEQDLDRFNYNYNDSPFDQEALPWMSILAYDMGLISPLYNDGKQLTGWRTALGDVEKVLPEYNLQQGGSIGEYNFVWGGNFSNRLHIGVALNVLSVNYWAISNYGETFAAGGYMNMRSKLETKGNGVNANFGAIVTPVDFLRLGLSLQTPTVLDLRSYSYSKIIGQGMFVEQQEELWLETPADYLTKYSLHTPAKLDASAAFLFGKSGLLSLEYIFQDFSTMKISGGNTNYDYDNEDIRTMVKNTSTLKIGGEFKPVGKLALRAGFAYQTPKNAANAEKLLANNTMRTDAEYFVHNYSYYYTAGIGYRDTHWYIDFAFINKLQNDTFYAFNSNKLGDDLKTTPAKVNVSDKNWVLTFGVRF